MHTAIFHPLNEEKADKKSYWNSEEKSDLVAQRTPCHQRRPNRHFIISRQKCCERRIIWDVPRRTYRRQVFPGGLIVVRDALTDA
ncbi:hypothetical protein PoB_004066100 [Plakobranchus ocellatus]|uniref:Uncharacterized protein n=1 Tax=Plakobranchus ocellatus TaxID=259542 RepID=A0AAV4ASQ6_9GAST|nr:hypothetical protein PoB_004066100 [Plakobranchus ocellatus]